MKILDSKNDYKAPQAKVVIVTNGEVLCASTEGYSIGSRRYDEGDWE